MLPDGSRLYVYTVIDLYSRWAHAEVVQKIGSAVSFAFVERAASIAPFPFEMVQTDNGPEFQKMFLFQLAKRGIALRHSRVRKSNDNAHIERFNRSVQEECLDHTAHTLIDFKKALRKYLFYYNTERMHMGINFKTPAQMLEVSPSS
jgi:transposase InsO family protein